MTEEHLKYFNDCERRRLQELRAEVAALSLAVTRLDEKVNAICGVSCSPKTEEANGASVAGAERAINELKRLIEPLFEVISQGGEWVAGECASCNCFMTDEFNGVWCLKVKPNKRLSYPNIKRRRPGWCPKGARYD